MNSPANKLIVDLGDFRSGGSKVFIGRERGEHCRREARLSKADSDGVAVEIRVPLDVFSINSSFFLGMFGDSIRSLGEEVFRRRYSFTGKDVASTVEDGIREALSRSNPLRAAV